MTTRLPLISTLVLGLIATSIARATTYTVSNTNDNGSGSLRQAILDANGAVGPHIIDATGITGTISLQSALPALNRSITINGPTTVGLTVTRGVATAFNIFTVNTGQTVTINRLTITNGSNTFGGGINNAGTLTINNSTISGNNTAGSNGGGIYTSGASAALTINNSTISGNISGAFGGAIAVLSGSATLTNVTITGNTAAAFGGGIYSNATVTVRNSIIAGNTASSSSDLLGSFTSSGNNLIGNGTGATGFTNGVNNDQVGTAAAPINPNLGPLQNNGGPTETRALLSGSPAINAGSDAVLSAPYNFTTDQRGLGFARKTGSSVDIGAFEFGSTDSPLPVELTGFSLASSNSTVYVTWNTASEIANAGFEVQRADENNASFYPIASYLNNPELAGLGTSSHGRSYSLTDQDLVPGVYRYRLVDITTDGIRTEHEAKTIRIEDASTAVTSINVLRLNGVTPNPVASEMQVSYSLAETMPVSMEVYTADGRLVATPLKGEIRTAGNQSQGISVAGLTPGAYMLRLAAGLNSRVQQFVVVH